MTPKSHKISNFYTCAVGSQPVKHEWLILCPYIEKSLIPIYRRSDRSATTATNWIVAITLVLYYALYAVSLCNGHFVVVLQTATIESEIPTGSDGIQLATSDELVVVQGEEEEEPTGELSRPLLQEDSTQVIIKDGQAIQIITSGEPTLHDIPLTKNKSSNQEISF